MIHSMRESEGRDRIWRYPAHRVPGAFRSICVNHLLLQKPAIVLYEWKDLDLARRSRIAQIRTDLSCVEAKPGG